MYNYKKSKLDDHVFNFIYGCALHDAVLQKAFEGDRKWIRKVSESQNAVKNYIDSVIKGDFKNADNDTKIKHEKLFLETAKEVCDKINNSSYRPSDTKIGSFTFGNAQKLINMTIKHVYAHTYSINQLGHNSIRDCFRHCHCPMDSIMLDKVWKEYKNTLGNDERKKQLKVCADFCQSWGNEDFCTDKLELPCRYKKFQESVKDIIKKKGGDILPIEYDYIFW